MDNFVMTIDSNNNVLAGGFKINSSFLSGNVNEENNTSVGGGKESNYFTIPAGLFMNTQLPDDFILSDINHTHLPDDIYDKLMLFLQTKKQTKKNKCENHKKTKKNVYN
jgi:hypothetical protein